MNEPTLHKILSELTAALIGQKFGKIFTLSKTELAIDFRLPHDQYLLIDVQVSSPKIYLVIRRFKTLEKMSKTQLPFVALLRKRLANSIVESIEKIPNERVLKINLVARNELGDRERLTLVVQLTGRSSNLFLLDDRGFVIDSLRDTNAEGQSIASRYELPVRKQQSVATKREFFPQGNFRSLSEALDSFYLEKKAQDQFQSVSNAANLQLSKELKKKTRLQKALRRDLRNHGNAEEWKHLGDVLLANVSTAKRTGSIVSAIDYFAEDTPIIEINVEENVSITEAAEKLFKKYTKARNAKKEISRRLESISKEVERLQKKKKALEDAIKRGDEAFVKSFIEIKKKPQAARKRSKSEESFSGAKRYVSSDGFDVLVGKRSKDNDFLTFRIAKSLDTWLHAADYPGSHVVIRNPNRREIPQGTLVEAAQLAAFYSKAKNEAKVAVHYTQKKFVNKPKGAAPGLVSLASFKTVLVRPKVVLKRKDE